MPWAAFRVGGRGCPSTAISSVSPSSVRFWAITSGPCSHIASPVKPASLRVCNRKGSVPSSSLEDMSKLQRSYTWHGRTCVCPGHLLLRISISQYPMMISCVLSPGKPVDRLLNLLMTWGLNMISESHFCAELI